jgi:hypothetical protein
VPIFTKLASTEQVCGYVLYRAVTKPEENYRKLGKIALTHVNKVRFSIKQFSRNSRIINGIKWEIFYTKFHPNWYRNMESRGRKSFSPLKNMIVTTGVTWEEKGENATPPPLPPYFVFT